MNGEERTHSHEEEQRRQGATGSLNHLYRDWFLDYASYVILDRAIPALDDGLKPVQRRILHAMAELEDGRYNKAANIIGHTMRYHPHGDMAISDAMVRLAQKELLIETQGNWGNPLTGDRSAAPRYIEGRLSAFAKDIVFNPEITEWLPSYDGRNREPLMLPVRFPLLLAQGADGIAVGLSTKILPHNFCELIRESIAILKGFRPQLLPDFQSGGLADFSGYQDGKKGSRVRIRAKIEISGPKILAIREVPYGVTTSGLIDSILAAHDKGQIKIKKVVDNTAENIEIIVHLTSGSDPEMIRESLFAFTDCEVSISPNCCVIYDGKPKFCSVSELLIYSTQRTKDLLDAELKISRKKIKEKLFFGILEHYFIREKIYRQIERCDSWADVISLLSDSVRPIEKKLHRPVTEADLEALTEVRIKRISKFDQNKATESLKQLKKELEKVNLQIKNINDYCIDYFEKLLKTYGRGRERKTKVISFSRPDLSELIHVDQKLFINKKEGFIGTSLKKDEFLLSCTKLDDIIAFCQDGSFQVSKISDKTFYGKNILQADIFRKGDEQKIWNILYREGKGGPLLAKRFPVLSATRDKLYSVVRDQKDSRIMYISSGKPEETETVLVRLRKKTGKESDLTFDFSSLEIKKRSSRGSVVTESSVTGVNLVIQEKSRPSVLNQRLWFDRSQQTLNQENKGHYLGKFVQKEDLLIVTRMNGTYMLLQPSLDLELPSDLIQVEKLKEHMVISAVCTDLSSSARYMIKTYISEMTEGEYHYADLRAVKIGKVTLSELTKAEIAKRATMQKAPATEKYPMKTELFPEDTV